MKSRTLRINPFCFFLLAIVTIAAALVFAAYAPLTETHLREQWGQSSVWCWWIASISGGLWVATSLLGRWYDKYGRKPSTPTAQTSNDADRSPVGHQIGRISPRHH